MRLLLILVAAFFAHSAFAGTPEPKAVPSDFEVPADVTQELWSYCFDLFLVDRGVGTGDELDMDSLSGWFEENCNPEGAEPGPIKHRPVGYVSGQKQLPATSVSVRQSADDAAPVDINLILPR